MSSAYFGRTIPVALRPFPLIYWRRLDKSIVDLPVDLAPRKLHHVILLFENKQIWQVGPWVDVNKRFSATLTQNQGESENLLQLSEPHLVFVKSPWRRLFHSFWLKRCLIWASAKEIDLIHVGAVYRDVKEFKKEVGFLNSDLTNIFLWNDGTIEYCEQGSFNPFRHDAGLKKILKIFKKDQEQNLQIMN